jgi:large subunit ribosomal protein L6
MSRIGKLPIQIPAGVDVRINGRDVMVKGPKGHLQRSFKGVTFTQVDGAVTVTPDSMSRTDRSLWGLGRTLLSNMVVGVSEGFSRDLEINGVGYRAAVKGKSVEFNLGYSHPIEFPMPEGVTIEVDKQTLVKVSGVSKEAVGQAAAKIRSLRPPEPYKGKGVKYAGEHIRRKVGKAAK